LVNETDLRLRRSGNDDEEIEKRRCKGVFKALAEPLANLPWHGSFHLPSLLPLLFLSFLSFLSLLAECSQHSLPSL
jgi:hypothetical protein